MENTNIIPPQPPHSYRITLDLARAEKRMDRILLHEVKTQSENLNLKNVSRARFKALFHEGKVLIKGQRATPSSGIAKGITYVDILGF